MVKSLSNSFGKKKNLINSNSKLKIKNISLDNYLSNKIELVLNTIKNNKSLILFGSICATYKLVNVYYYY
mgnify:CR=1 FL=1